MTTQQRRRPTAADVARSTGLSRATVSYVLNSTPGQTIPEATRTRVLEAAETLGYVPNPTARALARGRSEVVVIDVSDIPQGDAITATSRALAEAFVSRGYVPVVNQVSRSTEGSSLLEVLATSIIPAVLVTMTELPPDVHRRLDKAGVGRIVHLAGSDADHSIPNQIATAARCQMDYLDERGHQSIAYAPAADPALSEYDAARYDAVRAFAAHRALTLLRLDASGEGPSLHDQLVRALDDGVSAVAAYNDDVALSVSAAAQRAGIGIPDRLAVIGIDDIPMAARAYPSLTTVAQDSVDESWIREIVDQMLDGRAVGPFRARAPHVIARESA